MRDCVHRDDSRDTLTYGYTCELLSDMNQALGLNEEILKIVYSYLFVLYLVSLVP